MRIFQPRLHQLHPLLAAIIDWSQFYKTQQNAVTQYEISLWQNFRDFCRYSSQVATAGYWYVFIAGAPQLDPPIVSTAGTGMTFKLKTFNSKAMGEVRQYGLILPPGYEHTNIRYPVIFLLHGGHDDARAWVDKIGIIPVVHDLEKSGKMHDSIVITPDGNDKKGLSPLFEERLLRWSQRERWHVNWLVKWLKLSSRATAP